MFKRLLNRLDKLSNSWYDFKKERAKVRLEQRKIKAEIADINREHSFFYARLSKVTTSKIVMYLIFINCVIIEVYAMYSMFVLRDLSSLSTLITAVVAQTIDYAIYALKSFLSTREEKRQELENSKFELDRTIKEQSILGNIPMTGGVEPAGRYDDENVG